LDINTLFRLYQKEREYQKCCFGDYKDLKSLNFASFIIFIQSYLDKCKECYSGKWDITPPNWLLNSEEMKEGSAPVDAYEELIKVFVLAGAALETFTEISPEDWRIDSEEEMKKWIKGD